MLDLLYQASEYLSAAVPLWRASEDAGLGYWAAVMRSILPQPTKETK